MIIDMRKNMDHKGAVCIADRPETRSYVDALKLPDRPDCNMVMSEKFFDKFWLEEASGFGSWLSGEVKL